MLYSERLLYLREEKEIKQYDIAKVLGVYKGVYNQYEREYVVMPIKHLNTICNYFNVSLDFIFSLSDKRNYLNNRKEIDKKIMGERLKTLRKKLKLTQLDFAKELKVSRTTITEYERGTNIIATPFLYIICKKYKISADYLLGKID